MAQGKYNEAIPIFRKSIDAIQKDYGSDSVYLVPSLHMLARSLWRNGEKAEAQSSLARCSKLTSLALSGKTGCDDEWLLYQGEFETAAEGFRAALAFEEKEGKTIFDLEGMPVWENLAEAEATGSTPPRAPSATNSKPPSTTIASGSNGSVNNTKPTT